MKKILLFVLLALGALIEPASAQQQQQALVVPSCGSQTLTAATYGFITMDTTGNLCGTGGGTAGGATAANQVTEIGQLQTLINQAIAAGTAGTPSTQVLTIQGITSMTPLTVAQGTGTNLHVVCDSGCSSSTAPADEATFTAGTTSQTPVGGFFQTTATSNPLSNGQMGAMQLTANRALMTNLRTSAGAEIVANGTADGVAASQIGLVTTARLQSYNGTTEDRVRSINTGELEGVIMDFAGNARGANVTAANELQVSVTSATGLAQGSTTSGQTGSMIMGAVTTVTPSYTTAQTAYASLDVKGNLRAVLGGGVPETVSATGTTGATAATLATSASTTTYICGFSIRANANAAATGNATVAGTITGTMNFTQWTAPSASGLGITEEVFTPCIPASAANTTIVVTSAAPSTGGVVSVSAWGYQQ